MEKDYASALADAWYWKSDGIDAIEGAVREALAKAASVAEHSCVVPGCNCAGEAAILIRALGAKP